MTDLATAATVIEAAGRARVPVVLTSEPGTGKSSFVRSVADSMNVPCEVLIGSLREPSDIAGLPVVTPEGVVLDPPAWARRLRNAGCGYLFIDELSTCAPSVQSSLLTVAQERVVGDLPLPDDVRIIAAMNPPDQAAGGYALEPPMANRFLHLDWTPTVEDWLDGTSVGWAASPPPRVVAVDPGREYIARASVLGFIRKRPTLLQAYPTDPATSGGPWPSRRSWDNVMKVLPHLREDDAAARRAVVCGLVGEGAGIEYLEWERAADLPDPADVVADPSIVDWSGERPDWLWAILTGVVARAAGLGTKAAWQAAWGPLVAAAQDGAGDVAAAAARPLDRSRPAGVKPPAAVGKHFGPVLRAAGLTHDTAAGVAGGAA